MTVRADGDETSRDREELPRAMEEAAGDPEEVSIEGPRRLLEYLAEGLVDEPEEVSVEPFEEDDGTIVLEVCVAAGDYGRVIGRAGRTAQALRTVVKAAATCDGRRVLVDIVD